MSSPRPTPAVAPDPLPAPAADWPARLLAVLLALWAVFGVSMAGGDGRAPVVDGIDEYTLKAAMLRKFVKLVSWPEEGQEDKQPLVVAVFGLDPFGKRLEETFAKRKEDERKVTIRRLTRLEDVDEAHVLFVPQREFARLDELLAATKQASVLLVGESEAFAARGGAINFYTEEDKLRFEINPEAAKRQRLKLSSDLLKLARIVKDQE